MSDNRSPTPSWWQTIPGMLTGLAAVITAVTGLIVAFNHTGNRSEDVDEVVDGDSAKEGEVVFELPMSVKDVVLQISSGDEKSRIPLKLP
ncbi:MAG TPA: hypothetical protein VGJ78_12070 [Vicinamibacterales bacterium]|jgi:hypothetical protein